MANRAPYRLKLLGAFELTGPDGRRIAISSRKSRALLGLLALARGGQRSRAWLQDRLWGLSGGEQASTSLRRELADLRRILNAPGQPALLEADRHDVRLILTLVELDVLQLETDLPGRNGLTPGELLEGLDLPGEEGFEDWLREQRSRLADTLERARTRAWQDHALIVDREETPLSPVRMAFGADPPLPIKPSISVLPFESLTGPPHLAESLAEQILFGLGQWSTLFVVIAGPGPWEELDPATTCRRLGVRYLLQGSVRAADGRIRVAVRLVDGVAGEHLWSEQLEDEMSALLKVQGRIAEAIVPIIDSTLEKHERRWAAVRKQNIADLHEAYWRANDLARRWQRDSNGEAIRLLGELLAERPSDPWASSLLALCRAIEVLQGWSKDPAASRNDISRAVEDALRSGQDDPYVLGNCAGALLGSGGDLAVADGWIARALDMNPRMPATLFWGGWIDLSRGDCARALDRFTLALRVNPQMAMRPYVLTGMGLALLGLAQPGEALPILADASAQVPQFAPAVVGAALCDMQGPRIRTRQEWANRIEAAGGLTAALRLLRHPAHRSLLSSLFPEPAGPDHIALPATVDAASAVSSGH